MVVIAITLSVVSVATPRGASAAFTVYQDDYAGWLAAVGGGTTVEDFADSTLTPGLSVVSTAGTIGTGRWNDRPVRGGASTTWSFDAPQVGFGGFYDLSPGGQGQGLTFTVTLAGGGTDSVPVETPRSFVGQFFGFVSTQAFTSVLINGGTQPGTAETHNMDNLNFSDGAVTATPLPPTMLAALGAGLVAAAVRVRRRPLMAA